MSPEDDETDRADYIVQTRFEDPEAPDGTYLTIEDLVPTDEQFSFDEKKVQKRKLQELLADHLHYTYLRGELRWPKRRNEIEERHNALPREHFPHAGDF